MSAIGAVTYSAPSQPPVAGAAAPATVTSTRIRGMDLSGDVVTDRVLNTYAADPIGLGSIESAIDIVSASMSYNPTKAMVDQARIPGTGVTITPGNGISRFDQSAVAQMPTSEFVARVQSEIAGGHQDLLGAMADGVGQRTAMKGFATKLQSLLKRGPDGMNVFDAKLQALELQKQEIAEKLRRKLGDPRVLLAKLNSLTIQQGLVNREREKAEDLLALLISLIIGVQIPIAAVQRLKELGLGELAESLIRTFVGNGQGLSRSMHRQVRSLESLGMSFAIGSEEDTEQARREQIAARQNGALATRDGRLVGRDGRLVVQSAAPLGERIDARVAQELLAKGDAGGTRAA